jgi:MFS family permease
MLPLTLPLLIVAPLGGRLYDKMGPRALTMVGAFLVAVGFVWTAAFLHEFDCTILVPAYVVMGVGLGLVMSPTNTDALNTAPDEHRGQASGVISTARQVGSTFGIAIGGTIVATISSNRIVSFLKGEGESSEQAQSLERVLAESEGSQAAITATSPQPSRRRSPTRLVMGSQTGLRGPIG